MTTPATHFKLGVLALAAIGGLGITAVALGVRAGRTPRIAYHTLFDESVQGLKVGAAVRFRGVRIGEVTAIEVASDRRRVDVALAVEVAAERQLALASAPATLATRLSSQGVTGVKFIDLDFGDPVVGENREHYLLSRPSFGKVLEDEGARLASSLPGLVEDVRGSLRRFDALVDDARAEHLPARLGATLDRAQAAIADARGLVPQAAGVLASARRITDDAHAWLPAVDRVLEGASGLLADARDATDSLGELARRTFGSADGLEHSIGDVGEAARAVRDFLDALDREPDMLVKGRAPARRP